MDERLRFVAQLLDGDRMRRLDPEIHIPAISTVYAVLDRHGLVKRRRKRLTGPRGRASRSLTGPTSLWCADYKHEFMLADRRYCYPLTIGDFVSPFLITCDALSSTKELYAFKVFKRALRDFGLPAAIRTDNGVPFAKIHLITVVAGQKVGVKIAIVLVLFDRKSIDEIVAPDPAPVFEKLGLATHLTPSRANGFASMVQRIKALAVAEKQARDQAAGEPGRKPKPFSWSECLPRVMMSPSAITLITQPRSLARLHPEDPGSRRATS